MSMKVIGLLLHFLIAKISSILFPIKPIHLPNDSFIEHQPKLYQSLPTIIPSINLCLGVFKNQCFDLIVSTTVLPIYIEDSSSSTKFFKKQYDASLSLSAEKEPRGMGTPLLNDYFFGGFTKETISIKDDNDSNDSELRSSDIKLKFFLFDYSKIQVNHTYDGFLGLRRDNEGYNSVSLSKYEFSLLSYLYKTNQIKHQNFAYKYESEYGGYIDIDIDMNSNSSNRKNGGKCSSNRTFIETNRWSCYLSEFSIGNVTHITNKTRVIFNSLLSLITMPKESGLPLFEYILNRTDGKCRLVEDTQYIIMVCDDDVPIESFPDLVLMIDGAELRIKWTNMMKMGKYKEKPKLISTIAMIINNLLSHKPLEWEIGLPGFVDYEYIFDQDDSTITIISSPIIIRNPIINTIIIGIVFFMAVLLFIGIIYLIVSSKKWL